MKNKFVRILISTIMGICMLFCGCVTPSTSSPADSSPSDSGKDETVVNLTKPNEIIKSVVEIGAVTGRNSPWNDTITGALVAGTDLGIPVYDSQNQRMLLLYGDTFSKQKAGEGSGYNDWRSNVCAYSTDFDLSDGLTLDGWITRSGREMAKELVPSNKTDNYEMTTIPTGAIEINGAIYMFYMSVRHWGANGEWTVNYCGLTKSVDGGENYTRVQNVAFTGIKDTITAELTGFEPSAVVSHYAPGLCQVYPLAVGEYVYLYGIQGGRFDGVQLARVKASDIENFDKYEYFTGLDENNQPKFVVGTAGSKYISAEENKEATQIIIGPAGEMCVMYNNYLGKYMTIYQMGQLMVMRTADNPWGKWSEPITLFGYESYHAMYCGFMHEKYTEQNGKIVYFMMSYWWDYESILMKLELQ